MKTLLLFVVAFCVGFTTQAEKQHHLSSNEIREEIDNFVEALMACNNIPAMSLAVTRADEVRSGVNFLN